MNTWIDVRKELPKEFCRLICVIAGDKFKDVRVLDFVSGGYNWYDPETLSPVDRVTHWMLIPEMPE